MDYIALSIPVFFILIGIELAYSAYKGIRLYRFNDTITNIGLGIGQQVLGVLMKGSLLWGYLYLYENYKLLIVESTIMNWVLLFIAVDLLYYWFHRLSHEINFLWAAHIVHHQSEEYNLSVALRQSWIQNWFSWVFYLPLAIFGFEPIMFLTVSSFNTLYQFWIHTRVIGKLGPLEWIFSTPSHHRVHHGSDPKYIDRNHAGSLIIWDRLFGTFAEEAEEPLYGITKPLNSWNPMWANFHYWKEMYENAMNSRGFLDKIRAFTKSPGWKPGYLGGSETPQEIDRISYIKYDHSCTRAINWYVGSVFLVSFVLAILMLFNSNNLAWPELIHLCLVILLGLTVCGSLMDGSKIAGLLEYARIMVLISGSFLLYSELELEWITNTVMILSFAQLVIFRYVNNTNSET